MNKVALKDTVKLSPDQNSTKIDDEQAKLNKAAGVNSSTQQLKEELNRQKEEEKLQEEQEKERKQKIKQGIIQTKDITNTVVDAYSGAHKTVMDTADTIRDTGLNLWDSLGRVPTPGSIFLPVSILLLFFFILLPINGHTRIEWLWLALTGEAEITGTKQSQKQTVEQDVLQSIEDVYRA